MPLQDLAGLDLGSPPGMALLRRFDAQLRQLPSPEERREAVRRLQCIPPLSDRATGLMVIPGGSLALRQGQAVLLCEPASALWLPHPGALREALAALPGVLHVAHGREGLALVSAGETARHAQCATLVPDAAALAPFHPACGQGQGPALLRWSAWGAVMWRMRPAPPPLALAISASGESLPADGGCVPREIWDAPQGDERYQLLSSGLFAHLDELLGNEVSDSLRFALVDHWTDGDHCMASLLADQLGLLPACFATPWHAPAGLAALGSWPRAAAAMGQAARPLAMLGIARGDWGGAWRPAARQNFLRLLRTALPAGLAAELVSENAALPPQPLWQLGADRQMRCGAEDCCALLPASMSFAACIALARQLAGACGAPVQCAVPAWGLAQRFDPAGCGEGNAAWYGLAPAVAEMALEA
ncbi:hypothetical protein CR162_17225 [Pseudoroseomonas rhizosphaerae]|uniref:Uncharacterized protein n=1 Tax=Teichococcus rhizosphaerae TaxID=1335062 RepID=A0A2C7A103_9PROT|nr:hypothetical protein [Pseudoroseomonas rhizosphaerae]PHK93728.1 hypothetical protein CR162_17225 [Pseudoroseomonas rhizosphaerae]